jgi:DNA-binding transcriptional regulator YhcF (GntR family)
VRLTVNKESEVPVRLQIITQIELGIATGELSGGDLLPSVRAVARRLSVHPNTVSHAYSLLVDRGFLTRRRGARVAVQDLKEKPTSRTDLDSVLDEAVKSATRLGYSFSEFRQRVLARFGSTPPEQAVVVAWEENLGKILQAEIEEGLGYPVERCPPAELRRKPLLARKPLIVTHTSMAAALGGLLDAGQTIVVLRYNPTEECEEQIRRLTRPSMIGLVSISPYVLDFARLVFSPLAGNRHTIQEHVAGRGFRPSEVTADLLFCDSVVWAALPPVLRERYSRYRIVSPASIEEIRGIIGRK